MDMCAQMADKEKGGGFRRTGLVPSGLMGVWLIKM